MANIPTLKGVRTKYRKTLELTISKARGLLKCDVSNTSEDEFLCEINRTKDILKLYSEKLLSHMERLTEGLDESDVFLQTVVDEDCDLNLEVEHWLIKLRELSAKTSSSKTVDTESKESLQEQMNRLMLSQMEQQREMLAAIHKKEQNEVCAVKLPKLDLDVFYGNKVKWCEFWESFESVVHKNSKLSNIEKFNYLHSKLGGDARRAIAGLAKSGDNYLVAIGILRDRYGRKQEIVDIHYKELLSIRSPTPKVESLRTFMDLTEKHIRSLEMLGENINQNVFVSMICTKIPKEVLRQLEIKKGANTEWTVETLRCSLRDYILACEKAERGTSFTREERPSILNIRNAVRDSRSTFTPRRSENFDDSKHSYHSSAEALFASERAPRKQNSNNLKCRYCRKTHWSDECKQYATVDERKKKLKGCCFRCLGEGHNTKDCRSHRTCVYCNAYDNHHRSLCLKKFKSGVTKIETQMNAGEDTMEDITNSNYEENAMVSHGETVYMQTAKSDVENPQTMDTVNTRLLLDCGSQRTYITESLVKRLKLKTDGEEELRVFTFGKDEAKVIKTKTTKINLKLKNGSSLRIRANVVPVISGNIQRKKLTSSIIATVLDLEKTMDFADDIPDSSESSEVDLLIGNDYYLNIVLPQTMEITPGLFLLGSRLGWIITGRLHTDGSNKSSQSLLILTYGSDCVTKNTNVFQSVDSDVKPVHDLEDFWSIESIGINDKDKQNDDTCAFKKFKDTLKFENGRYEVTWPWKEDFPDLPRNKELAYGRLKSSVKRMANRPDVLQKYDSIIREQLSKGVIERVEDTKRDEKDRLYHYIPHHPVITPNKTTTKLRIVYDASAKTKKENKSLNECLFRGPVLLKDLCGLLMRFRLHSVAVVADIEKAFLQIGLQEKERDVTRFLWLKNAESCSLAQENIETYRFCRVPFGIISSPFLLSATIEAHLETYNSEIADKLKHDIYVDNVITGAKNDQEAIQLYKDSKSMFQDASMNLREWISNSSQVNQAIPETDRAEPKDTHVLGHCWDHQTDTLSIKPIRDLSSEQAITKRNILKQEASVYDPMGLFTPVLLPGKKLIQELWEKGYDWDDVVTDKDVIKRWTDIASELVKVSECKVPRNISSGNIVKYNIVGYCDASTTSYATAVYLEQEIAGRVTANLIFAKSRLAPVNKMTVPRLELMAVVIGVRCIAFVESQLKLNIVQKRLYSDSQVVLGWIHSKKILPVFVKNRVKEIQQHSDISIAYINTKENPADIATRGSTVKSLRDNNLWWHGPCICEFNTELKVEKDTINAIENTEMCSKVNEKGDATPIADNEPPCGIDVNRYSSLIKLLRVTALVVKFTRLLKKSVQTPLCITSSDIEEAEQLWLVHIQRKHYTKDYDDIANAKPSGLQRQLGLYLDDKRILRCKGRLDNSCLTEGARRPILLPHKDRFTVLVIENAHQQSLHYGVSQTLAKTREKYWITRGRSVVKSTIRQCRMCRRYAATSYRVPEMPPLPSSRVNESSPFDKVGLDYLGPLNIKHPQGIQKRWLCLFTCMNTRAIHMELIQDLTTEEFLMCFRRFISQRGTPSEITSDNATQFKLASKVISDVWKNVLKSDDVQSYVSTRGIKWNFIVELAPWMGGFYERLVGVVKSSLRKSLGRKLLTQIQLQTLIKEIEATVNSRPLVYVESDLESNITISPSHFLSLNPKTGIPSEDDEDTDAFVPVETTKDKLLKTWKKGQKALDEFWKIWREEYLVSLRERTQTLLRSGRFKATEIPKVGDVVQIKENCARGCWKVGRVAELVPSSDGHIRSVKVTLPNRKVLGRPLKLLYPLECEPIEQCSTDKNIVKSVSDDGQRPTRIAAVIAREKIARIVNR